MLSYYFDSNGYYYACDYNHYIAYETIAQNNNINETKVSNSFINQNDKSINDEKWTAGNPDFVDESGSAVPLPEELTKMFKPLECELCGVIVTSETTAYTHYEGKIHTKNVNAYMKEQYNISGSMRKEKAEFLPHQCEVCKCDLSSLIQAQQHYIGKVHKKNLRKINYDPQNAVPLSIPSELGSLSANILDDFPPPPPPPLLSDFICEICNVTTNTEFQLNIHKNGAKHQRKVKKWMESLGECGTDGFNHYPAKIPEQNYEECRLDYSIAAPLVTDYLPLSDQPLIFDNCQDVDNNIKNENITDTTEKYSPLSTLLNDINEPPPERAIEDKLNGKFASKNNVVVHDSPVRDGYHVHAVQTLPLSENSNELEMDNTIRSFVTPEEVANLPHFSVADILTQLQTPILLSSLSEEINSDNGVVVDSPKQAIPSNSDVLKINFDDAKLNNRSSLVKNSDVTFPLKSEDAQKGNIEDSQKKKKLSNLMFAFKKEVDKKKSEEKGGKSSVENILKYGSSVKEENNGENREIKKPNILKGIEKNIVEDSDEEFIEVKVPSSVIKVDKQEILVKKLENYKHRRDKNFQRGRYEKKYAGYRSEDHSRNREHRQYNYDYHYKCRDSDEEEWRDEKRKYRYSSWENRHSSGEEPRIGRRRHKYSSDDDISDEKHRKLKKKRRYLSRDENHTHSSHKYKKSSLAQPFYSKSSKKSIIDYLAPFYDADYKDIALYRTPSGSYYCSTCKYKAEYSSEFTDHLYSQGHIDKKKKKR